MGFGGRHLSRANPKKEKEPGTREWDQGPVNGTRLATTFPGEMPVAPHTVAPQHTCVCDPRSLRALSLCTLTRVTPGSGTRVTPGSGTRAPDPYAPPCSMIGLAPAGHRRAAEVIKARDAQGAAERGRQGRRSRQAGTELRGAELRGTGLCGAELLTVLRGAELRGAKLLTTELRGAELRGAELRGAERLTKLRITELRGAELLTEL